MAWCIIGEESVLEHFISLSNAEENCISVGLIIGQVNSSKKKAYVVHVAPTPEQSRSQEVKCLDDVDEELVAAHARFVTRMLPGGLSILGIFFVTDDEVFVPSALKIFRRILTQIESNMKGGFFLDGKSPCSERFILHFNSKTKRHCCKNISESLTGTLNTVECRFQSCTSSWIEVASEVHINEKEFDLSSASVKDQLLGLLTRLRQRIESSTVLLNGKELDASKCLESVVSKKAQKSDNRVSALIYSNFTEAYDSDIKFFTSVNQRITMGSIPSKIFMEPSATVRDTITAVKQDLIRSLGARLELHWDSLVDEEGGSPEEKERVHEPPRRVLLQPNGSRLCFVDYLFPGENVSSAVASCGDLLDIAITEKCVFDRFEIPADSRKFISSTIVESSLTGTVQENAANQQLVIAACAVALLAIIAYLLIAS